MGGYVVNDDNDRVRKRRGGARDPSPKGIGGIPVNTASSSSSQNGTSTISSYSHVGRRKKGGSRRRSSSALFSLWKMNLRKTRSPLFIGLVVVIFGTVLAIVLIAAATHHFSSSFARGCNESHINGIPGNIYNWCYKTKSKSNYNNNNNDSIHSRILSSLSSKRAVERVVFDDNNVQNKKHPKQMIAVINAHERLAHEIVAEDQDEICYADIVRFGTRIGDGHSSYFQPVIGPCHYDYPLTVEPLSGSYEEAIDFYFYRESEESKYTDKLKCLNECMDRVLLSRNKGNVGKHHGHLQQQEKQGNKYRVQQESVERSMEEIGPEDMVPVDDIMLIEAARAGMTFVVEKLLLKHGLDPLYRQVKNQPSSSRNLNAIQEAIRGGYAEIVGILTAGDNSIVIDDYGRTVEDYIKMSGSPIRPVDAKNVLGIDVEEGIGHYKRPQQKQRTNNKKSGWSETTANPYNKDRCDFDVVDSDLPPEVFYRDYFMTGRPVVLRGQVPQMELDMFSKKRWKTTDKYHPNQKVSVGPTAYPELTNQELCSSDMSIKEIEHGAVCEEMPEKPMVHAFHPIQSDFIDLYPDYDGEVLDKRGGFRSIQQFFGLVEQRTDLVWQVFFGGDGSGATYHWHEAAFNILYVGIKEWKIAPPLYRGTTGMTAQKVAATLDEKISLTCIQQPGDMFYIPNYWGHSTINHGFTIGAAAIVEDWYQNGGTTLRGEVEEEYEESEQQTSEDSEDDEEEEDTPPFLFVHINKTGGTSLISMFRERCEDEYYGDKWYSSNGDYHRAFHATAHAYIAKYGRKTWEDAYTFTVVRHPLARQVSNFFFLVSMGCDKRNSKCSERLIPTLDLDSISDEEKIEAFHDWILKLYKKFPPGSLDHYRFGAAGHGNEVYDTFGASQTSWLVDANGEMVIKDIYQLEELSKDISKLADNIPCLKNGPLDMAKENKTSKYPHYLLFAKDEQTKNIINEVFADDFKHLGYDAL